MSTREIRKWGVRTAIALLFFYSPIASVNPASRLALIDSLLSRGTPGTAESRFFNRVDMVHVNGQFYSDKPPLLALYSTAVISPVYGPLSFDRGPAGKVLYWLVVASASGLALVVLVLSTRAMYREREGWIRWTWLAFGVVACTCVLPFGRTYNDHIVEAAVLLVVFVLLRGSGESPALWRPLVAGSLIGLTWLLHPLIGSATALTTGFYYLLRGRGGTLSRRFLSTTLFSAGTLGIIGLGTGLHIALYDRAAPFYFSPELYLWVDGPGGVESYWLSEPTVPGLTTERIAARFKDLGLSPQRLDETLSRFAEHSESVGNPLRFALQRFFRYGQLTFNPLVLFCLLLAAASIRRKNAGRAYRAETVWVLASTAAVVAASIWLRAVPGGSFGDRHLLPTLPLLVVAGGLAVASPREAGLFRTLALLSMVIMIPGAIAPWVTPGDTFLGVNLGITILAIVGAVMTRRSPEGSLSQAWDRVAARVGDRLTLLVAAVLTVLEVYLYLATLPTA